MFINHRKYRTPELSCTSSRRRLIGTDRGDLSS